MTSDNKLVRKTQRTSQVSTVISMSLVLFLIGVLGLLLFHAQRISNYVKENIELSIMILPDADSLEIQNLFVKVSTNPIIKSAILISREEAAESLKKDLGEDFVSFLGYNPLNASVDVRIRAEFTDTTTINKFIESISDHKAVSEIHYQASLVQEINKNLRTLVYLLLGFSALLLIVSVTLINNTIRLNLYAKRMLIKSMLLVGATKSFIRKPFLLRSFLNGLIGSLCAVVLLSVLLYVAFKKLPELEVIQDYNFLGLIGGGLVVLGIILSLSCTLFAVNKYLRLRSEDLF